MILHSCGVLQHNSRFARAGFVVLLAVDCVKGWVGPRSGLLRGTLHHSRGDLLFSLFKGFPALPAPIIAPIHEKKHTHTHRAQVDGDGTYKSTSLALMFTDDRCLRWRVLGRQPTCEMFLFFLDDDSTGSHSCVALKTRPVLYVLGSSLWPQCFLIHWVIF